MRKVVSYVGRTRIRQAGMQMAGWNIVGIDTNREVRRQSVQLHFPDAEVAMNVDHVGTMAREFLIESIEAQRDVVLGEKSRYYEVA